MPVGTDRSCPALDRFIWLTSALISNEVMPETWWDYFAAAALCGFTSLVIPPCILIDRWRHPPQDDGRFAQCLSSGEASGCNRLEVPLVELTRSLFLDISRYFPYQGVS
jgi:hypothetical protein